MSLQMRVGLGQFNELTDEKLAFIKQMGCDDFLMNTPKLPGDKQWEYDDLAALKKRADDAELRLMALENVPTSFYDQIMLGQSGREEQLQHMITTVRNMGKAGIPILGYHWIPNSVWRTPEPADPARRCPRHSLCPRRARPRGIDPWPRLHPRGNVGKTTAGIWSASSPWLRKPMCA